MLVSNKAYNIIASIEIISPNFQVNPQKSVISYYNPTNFSDKQETWIFYTKLTCLKRHIPKHNVLIIVGNLNSHLGKDIGYKYAYHQTSNRNGQLFKENLREINIICLKSYFQKKKHGEL